MKLLQVLFLLPLISACNPWAELRSFFGIREEKAEKSSSDSAVPPRSSGGLAKENQELLAEVIRVVFDREDSEDQADFDALAQTLNQGASLEGIYRGIIMGSRYRALESNSQAAAPRVLKVFATEMSILQEGMRNPTRFDPEEARKPPRIDYPEEAGEGSVSAPSVSSPAEFTLHKDRDANFQFLMRIFVGASPYTLKRALCEEALRRFDEAGEDPSAIPLWYGNLVVRLSKMNVDFGLELRNRPDLEFHQNFARKIALDRVKWEVLNRFHRYLNAAVKQSG